jgi:putative alpha-1,2-mannosidase
MATSAGGLPHAHGLAAPTTAAHAAVPAAVSDPASLANRLLGTSNGGDTCPGADTPFGMARGSPDPPSRPPGGDSVYFDNVVTGPNTSTADGARLEVRDCDGGTDQKWDLPP